MANFAMAEIKIIADDWGERNYTSNRVQTTFFGNLPITFQPTSRKPVATITTNNINLSWKQIVISTGLIYLNPLSVMWLITFGCCSVPSLT